MNCKKNVDIWSVTLKFLYNGLQTSHYKITKLHVQTCVYCQEYGGGEQLFSDVVAAVKRDRGRHDGHSSGHNVVSVVTRCGQCPPPVSQASLLRRRAA